MRRLAISNRCKHCSWGNKVSLKFLTGAAVRKNATGGACRPPQTPPDLHAGAPSPHPPTICRLPASGVFVYLMGVLENLMGTSIVKSSSSSQDFLMPFKNKSNETSRETFVWSVRSFSRPPNPPNTSPPPRQHFCLCPLARPAEAY